ncbi:MAG: type II toxin-antitoxin system RelE/ParE family toxin [Anaerolineae bacterium]
MRFQFADAKLQSLYTDDTGADRYPEAVVNRFFKVVGSIEAARDERDFYALKSLHFELLKGERGRRGERSMRLNAQYRLIVTLEDRPEGRTLVIHAIEDYH